MNSFTHRLLLVDDQVAIRALISLELHGKGFAVTAVATAREALKLLEEKSFHVVVLDVVLEETDGFDILEVIKEHHPNLPVVMLSGTDMAEEALAKGADAYVSKGFSMGRLVKELRRVLGTGGAASG